MADRLVFVGLHVGRGRAAVLFSDRLAASAFLAEAPIAVEFIYIKASRTADHLERIMPFATADTPPTESEAAL